MVKKQGLSYILFIGGNIVALGAIVLAAGRLLS